MSKLADTAAALCVLYPHKHELSKARLTKLVYLVDWKAVQKTGEQMTDIEWVFYKFGPYVDDVYNAVRVDGRFSVEQSRNMYGEPKAIIGIPEGSVKVELSAAEIDLIKEVVSETKSMYWDDFIKHVYNTPPIAKSDRYARLDLKEFAGAKRAQEYKERSIH